MASAHEIIGEEWRTRATELADWADAMLVNRRDVWGQYSVATPTEKKRDGRSYKAMTLPAKSQRGGDKVTLDKLTRHFASRRFRKPQLIGLHAKSTTGTSRWLGIDIDCHEPDAPGAEDLARRNLNAVINWYRKLTAMGHDPLVFNSNGAGGYHLWVLFAQPAPTEDVFAFAQWIIEDWQEQQLEKLPETFPKQLKEQSLGSWFRLPGLHHTRDHYSTVWAGDDGFDNPWLSGHAAIDAMLAAVPGPPPNIPSLSSSADENTAKANKKNTRKPAKKTNSVTDARPGDNPSTAPASKRGFKRTKKPRVCVDLDGVLAHKTEGSGIGAPIDGAVEFTRALIQQADIIIFTARFSTRTGKARSSNASAMLAKRIEKWLDAHGFAYTSINQSVAKPIASAYIDDRAVPCTPETDGSAAFDAAILRVNELN